jgi:hypothetical protein
LEFIDKNSIFVKNLIHTDMSREEYEYEIIPGLPRTDEEKLASIERGMKDYRQGKSITHEEFLKEQKTWKSHGCLAPEKL